jgi:hypothetical protein
MVKVLLIMHHVALCTPCITLLLVSHTCVFMIDPSEQELEEVQEPAPAEKANLEQEKGKARCI